MVLCLFRVSILALLFYVHVTQADAHRFFSSIATVNAILAPDGATTALLQGGDKNIIFLLNNSSGVKRKLFSAEEYTTEDSQINNMYWLDSRYLAVQFSQEVKGIEGLLDTKLKRRLLILDTQMKQSAPLSVRTAGWLAHPKPGSANLFYYAKSGRSSKLYAIKVDQLLPEKKRLGKLDRADGGQFKRSNEVRSIKGYALRWYFSANGEVSGALALSQELKLNLVTFDKSGGETVLNTWSHEDDSSKKRSDVSSLKAKLYPMVAAETPSTFYCLDKDENNERTVYWINYETGETKKVYQTSSYQITDIILDENNEFKGVTVLKNGAYLNEYLSDSSIRKKNGNTKLSVITSVSEKPGINIRYEEAHNVPGHFILSQPGKPEQEVGRRYNHLQKALSSTQIHDRYTVDGISIPYLLNTPKGEAKAYPLIVLPHGGPIGVYDKQYFDPLTQFLIDQQYAVLRINYRGSSGYSDKLLEAGKKQWGDLILKDIHEVQKIVRKRANIDGHRVALMGLSYGGYATAALLTQYPKDYRCGVAIAGPYDVNLYLNFKPRDEDQRKWLNEYIGNSENEFDRIQAMSPLYQAEKLQRPLLIMHGAKDASVSVEQAYRYDQVLTLYDKPHELYINKNLGHAFDNSPDVIEMMNKAVNYLNIHLRK